VRAKAVKLLIVCAMTVMVSSLGAQAMAQEEQEQKSTKPAAGGGDKKKTKIDFEDELIEGELKKPELFYLLQKKQFNFKRLIKLREDFLPEMRRDGDEIRRGKTK
jgi:hypothetical protein